VISYLERNKAKTVKLKTLAFALICTVGLSGFAVKYYEGIGKDEGTGKEGGLENVIEPLRPYVMQVILEMNKLPDERKEVLEEIAHDVSDQIKAGRHAQLIYICTHNSRRSHMAQLWAQTAASYYGIDHVSTFSGGTEATEFNHRAAAALRRVGFSVVGNPKEENPVYLIQYSDEHPPMEAFSKLYNEGGNPTDEFIALMCCSAADMECPVVAGADSRYAIHYVDPKESDDTSDEVSSYDSRCREIAHEMFYLMAHVSN